MKKLYRLFSVILLAAIAALSMSSCHGSRNMPVFNVPEEFDVSKNYEITFWAKNDTNKTQTNVYKKAITDFEALYPNIKVNLRLYTDYGRIYNDVITNIQTGTTPNVCITYPDHIATYLKGSNTVVPLDTLFKNKKYGFGGSELRFDGPSSDEMINKFLDECMINGIHYAIPYMRSTEACYINKTFLDKLGYELPEKLTWDFVWEISDAAAKKNSDGTFALNGQKVMLPFVYKSTDNMMIQMLRQKGGGYSDSSGRISLFNDTTKELLKTVAAHVRTGAFSTFKISGYPGNFLNAGQCVFAIDSTAGATWMGKAAPHADISPEQFVDYEIAVTTIPQFDTSNPQMISQGPSVCVFNRTDPDEVLASWLFAQFLLTHEVQLTYSETEGYVPVTLKAQTSDEYKDYLSREGENNSLYYDVKIKAAKLLLNNMDNTFITPVFAGSASVRDAAGQL
ncbi:MAG: extracellular solute-binding protein, partial [Clostridia bacterium]|nr:extracellular solute-binding protein [Clostridia bacterium]